jgi:hypothetical protein
LANIFSLNQTHIIEKLFSNTTKFLYNSDNKLIFSLAQEGPLKNNQREDKSVSNELDVLYKRFISFTKIGSFYTKSFCY